MDNKSSHEDEFNEKIDRQNSKVCGLVINILVSLITALFVCFKFKVS